MAGAILEDASKSKLRNVRSQGIKIKQLGPNNITSVLFSFRLKKLNESHALVSVRQSMSGWTELF